MIPELDPHCGSWIVVSRETGAPVWETYSRGNAEKCAAAGFEVLTAEQWLGRFNARVRAARSGEQC